MRLVLLALVSLVSLLAADPLQAIFDLAAKDLAAGNYASAERGFEKVLAILPNQVAAMGNLGVIYQRTRRPDKAIAIYKRALKVKPNDEGILLNLGLVYFKHDEYGQALPFFHRVVELNASNQQARQLAAGFGMDTQPAAVTARTTAPPSAVTTCRGARLRMASPGDEARFHRGREHVGLIGAERQR